MLKLFSKGDLSDEQLDMYEQDKGRLRVFVALKKQRQLTEDEQATVNEIGLRLGVEVAQLAGEDLGFARSKQATIDELMRARDVVEAQRVTETIERQRKQRLRPVLNADAEFRGLEDEEAFGYPSAISNLDSERMAARLAELHEIYDARDLQLRRSTRFADRNMTTALVRNTDPDVLTAAAAISQAQTESLKVNPRFARSRAKIEGQMPQLMDALELSRLPNAKEDKTNDYDLIAAEKVGASNNSMTSTLPRMDSPAKRGLFRTKIFLMRGKRPLPKTPTSRKKPRGRKPKIERLGSRRCSSPARCRHPSSLKF